MKNLYAVRSFLLLVLFGIWGTGWGQTAYLWKGTNGTWLTTTNWTPTGPPTGNTSVALFNDNTGSGIIGINMNGISTANSNIGGISYSSSATITRTINNSSSTVAGIYTLNGATINSIANTIIDNSSSATHNINNGASQALGIALGNTTENIISINGSGGITISSVISGANKLTKAGSGTGILTLSGVNTYGGATNISGGTLTAGVASALPSTTGLTLANTSGAILDLNNFAQTITSLSGGGTTGGNVTLGSAVLTISGSPSTTYSGVISGTGSLVKLGSGVLTFGHSANAYTGSTTISAGELRLNPSATTATLASQIILNAGKLSTTSITSGTTITNSSTLRLNASSTIDLGSNVHSLKFANSSSITWGAYTLTINGWTGTTGASGTAGKIFVGTDATGLSSDQLAKITFTGYTAGAQILSTGEIVPVPALLSPPTLNAAAGATVDNSFNVTFTDDATWRGNITSITIGGTILAPAAYSASASKITFTPSASTLLQSAGSKSIVVVATGYSNATVTQVILAGVATKLTITTQPTSPTSNGAVLGTQPIIAIQDQYGNITTSTATVNATVGAGTWTLGGTTSVAAVAGTTTFSGLTATSAAAVTGATITFSSGSLTSVTSSGFNIPSPAATPPVNDLCGNAVTLTVGTSATSGTTLAATATSPFTTPDVWYSFTPTCTGTATVTTTQTSQDIDLYVFNVACGSMTISNYIASGTGVTLTGETVNVSVTAGTTYYIRTVYYSGTSGSNAGSFNISVTNSVTPQFTLANTGTPAAGNIAAATSNAVLFGFALTPTACTNSFDFTAASISTSGTAASSDLSNFRLIVDANGNGVADAGEISSPVGTVSTLANPLAFSITGQTGITLVRRYLLIADVASGATPGKTFNASLTSANVTASVSVTGTANGNAQTITGTPPTLTAATGATVDGPFTITFTDNPAWRAAITSITVGGVTLTAGYTVSAGQITFTPSASAPATLLQTSGTKSIVVIATNYSNNTVSQAIGFGAAKKLGITTQPTSPSANGAVLVTQPVVAIQDQYGNTVATSSATVTATVGSGSWTIGGTTAVAASGGTSTFTDLTATSATAVTGATIVFSLNGLTGVTSGAFNIPSPNYISISSLGTAFTENFNTLASSGTSSSTPQGWYFSEAGTGANIVYAAGTGSDNSGDTYSFGSSSSADRAFGGVQSGTVVPTIGAKLTNTSGSTINTLSILYKGEEWRLGTASRADKLSFQYSTNATSLTTGTWSNLTSLDFSTPNTVTIGAKDGNASGNFTSGITGIITNLTLTNSSTIWIRWIDEDASGADDGLGIDDFSVTGCQTITSVLSGTAAICSGGSTNLQVAMTGGPSPYTLVYNDGTTDFTVNNYTTGSNISVSPTFTKTYSLVSVTSTGGCVSTNNSGTPTVTVNNPSTGAVLSGTASICSGSSTNLQIAITGGTPPFTVVYSDGISNFTVNNYTSGSNISVSPTSTKTYSLVSVTSTGGCTGTNNSGSATVTVNPLPTATISGTTSVCQNTTAPNITFIGSNGTAPYTFTYNINGGTNQTVTSGGGTNPVSVTVAVPTTATGTFIYNLVSVSGQFCSQAQSSSAIVTVNAYPVAPIITADGPTTFCTGGSVVLSSDRDSPNNWYKDGSPIPGATNKTYTATTSGTFTDVITNASGCSSTSNAITVTVTSTNTWTGVTSTDWSVGSNWCSGSVPDGTTDAIVPSGASRYPVLSVNSDVNALQVQSGASITLSGKTFTINGDVSGMGVLTGSVASKLVIGGAGGSGILYFDQTDSITNSLDSLALTRTNGNIGIGNKLNLLNVLNVNAGGTLNPNGNLVLRSTDSTKTARVAPVTGSIVGDVTVERYISSKRAYRFITPPVTTSQSIQSAWMEGQHNTSTAYANNSNTKPGYGTHITGSGGSTNGFDQTVTNNPSLFVWDNGTGQAYSAVSNVTSGGTLIAGKGYRLFVRGSRGVDLSNNAATPSSTILRVTGGLITGTVTFNTTSTVPLSGLTQGYSFLGNPYASPVKWSSLQRTDVTATYSTFDPRVNVRGAFVYYNASGHTNSNLSSKVNDTLQSGQGFFVQNVVGASNPSLVFKETNKVIGNNPVFRSPEANTTSLSVRLLLNNSLGIQNTADGVVALFDDAFSTDLGDEDSYKYSNLDENIAIRHGVTDLSIEGRPNLVVNDTLQLKIWQYRQSNYLLRFDASHFNAGATIFVKDAYLNTETQINSSDSTVVPFNLTLDSASFAEDRFMIVLKPGSVLPVTITDVKAYQKGKGIQVDWISRTETNIARYEVEKSANGRDFEKAGLVTATGNSSVISYGWFDENPVEGNNFYRIRIVEKSGAVKYTQVVKVTIGKANSSIAVYPNPVKGNAISLHFVNMQKGRYTISLYNNLGQQVLTRKIEHDGASATYSIPAGRLISKGTYRLTATNGETEMNTTVIFE